MEAMGLEGLAAVIKARIEAGEWLPGEKLPNTDYWMRTYRLSESTVYNAMRVLRREGVVVGRQGGARYVAGGEISEDEATGELPPPPLAQ